MAVVSLVDVSSWTMVVPPFYNSNLYSEVTSPAKMEVTKFFMRRVFGYFSTDVRKGVVEGTSHLRIQTLKTKINHSCNG